MGAPVARLAQSVAVEPGEGRAFVGAAAALFLVGWASVSVTNVSETFFLKRIGVERLPLVFLVNSLLLVATTSAVGRIAARADHLRFLTRTFFALGLALVPLWLLVVADVRSVFVLLVIAAKQLDSIARVVFWIALGGVLHGRQAKRLYAPIMAGGTLGTILGSFASGPIGRALGIPTLLPVAAAAFGLAALTVLVARARAPVGLARARSRARAEVRHEALPALRPLWREGRLFHLLVVSALLCGVLGPMLYFQFSYVADLATQGSNGEQRLLDLYARFRGWINVGVLATQLVGTSRLFRTIGVPLASTVSPLVYLLGFAGLSVRLALPAGVAAVAAATLQDHAIYEPAQKILATLFRERVRPAVMTLVEGPVRRFGGALGNVVVLGALALGTPAWVGFVGLPIAGLWLAVAIVLWRIYPTLLLEVASARRAQVDERLPFADLVDARTLRLLEASLLDPDRDRCRAACELVAEAPRSRAIRALARAARYAPAENRALVVEALERLLDQRPPDRLREAEAARDLEPLLGGGAVPEPLARARLVRAYARLCPDLTPGSPGAAVLAPFLADPAEPVRLAASAALRGTADDLDAMLAAALASEDTAARHVALAELRAALLSPDGAGRWEARVALLTALLDVPRDRARAAEALADLAARHGARLAPSGERLVAHANDADPRVRAAVLRFVGHARLERRAAWVVERLGADDEAEAAAAREALRAFGPVATDALLQTLQLGKRAARDGALAVLRELRVDPATLRALIDRELDGIRRTLVQIHGLGTGPVSELVLERLRERVGEGTHTTLLVLAALRHEERIAVLARLLARSRGGRGRAVLLEALEALLPPEERERLMPLLEDRSDRALATVAARALGRELASFEDALRDTLADQDPLVLTFLAATLDARARARLGGAAEVVPGQVAFDPSVPLAAGGDLEDDGGRMLSKVEIVLHLRTLDLFAGLTTRQLSDLAGVVREESHPAGTTIVREGDFDDCMYLIVAGEVDIMREGKFLARMGAKEFFGEMALFDGETRAATATATRRVRLLRLERHDLFQVMDEQPGIAIAVCQTLSRRVRELLERVPGAAGEEGKRDG
jgi:hypothetical protein